jgi:site-specific DNA-methyltransferase (adenine-specific)
LRVERIGNATLYLGDCLEILPDVGLANALITDPPFFHPVLHYVNARKAEPTKKTLSDMSALKHFFRIVMGAVDPVLAKDGSIYWFCDGQTYGWAYEALYPHCKKVRPLIWDKITSYNGYTWRHQHELIAWGEREGAKRIPTGDGDIVRERAVPVAERKHPAEKPAPLVQRLLSKTDGVVLDPFMGGGTTGVACARLKRPFIGIELEEQYFDIACERIAAAQAHDDLFPEQEPA